MGWTAGLIVAGSLVAATVIVVAVVMATGGGSASEAPSQPSNSVPEGPRQDHTDRHRSTASSAPSLEAGRWFVVPSATASLGDDYRDDPGEAVQESNEPPEDPLLRLVSATRPDRAPAPDADILNRARDRLRSALPTDGDDQPALTAARVLAHAASRLCAGTPVWMMELLNEALEVQSGAAGELTLQRQGPDYLLLDAGDTVGHISTHDLPLVAGVRVPRGVRWHACVTDRGQVLQSRAECFVHWASQAGSCRVLE